MQSIKPENKKPPRSKQCNGLGRPALGAVAIFFLAVVIWLGTTAYVFGQFEIRQSMLVLNREGCVHLQQLGITPLPQSETAACRVELPYRPNMINAGGRIWLDERYVGIPERELIGTQPLADQPWTAHHWRLLALEGISMLLLTLSVWLTLSSLRRGKQQ